VVAHPEEEAADLGAALEGSSLPFSISSSLPERW